MEKVNAVLAVLNREFLESALNNLDADKVNLTAIFMDSSDKTFQFANKKIPVISFALIYKNVSAYKDFVWLVSGYSNGVDDFYKMKKFLMTFDVSEDNIINFEMTSKISPAWLANLRYVEEHGADFFATGNEYMRDGLNLKFIPSVNENSGVNLADAHQNLQQSYLTAKYVFEHAKPNTIKFVLIGLAPDSFCCDDAKSYFDLQQLFTLAKTAEEPDLNFDAAKTFLDGQFSAKAVADWESEQKISSSDVVEKNLGILKNYIELCLANGAKPIGVVFPFAPALRKTYNEELLKNFRETIQSLEENSDFTCVDMLDLNLNYDSFCDMTHLNLRGSEFANAFLAFKLRNLLPLDSFCNVTYETLDKLAYLLSLSDYNNLLEKTFEQAAQKIRNKDKIKLAFVLYDTSMWSGDELYNNFAQDSRFEVTTFLYKIPRANAHEFIRDDFSRGVEQLKSHGINVVAINSPDEAVPEQDVVILLTPYPSELPNAFQLDNLTAKTLVIYISYAFDIANRGRGFNNRRIFHTAWRVFLASAIGLSAHSKKSFVGMPRGFYSGYPRTDIFFVRNTGFHFDWKMARPDAKKIIWAPNHSIPKSEVQYATFQWNYKFMYDFAKAHPETSWVVKPHPALAFRAVDAKIFPDDKAFKDYMQKWDDLPNAKVYTGAYYQDLFATSDGMIHDSGSFIAEYQFVNKPMIFLTREGEKFNKLAEEILKASYLVDGKNFYDIAMTIQNVFIEGNDSKAAERKKNFFKYLNYPNANGMLASEFIYKNIADELKKQPLE